MKKCIVGLCIADIHINGSNYKQVGEEFEKLVFKRIEEYRILDYIVIAGDTYDTIMSMSSGASYYTIAMIKKLVDKCVENGVQKIRILKGTYTHDGDQLRLFKVFENRDDIDFRVIETVESELLFPNFRVLYLPEEYVIDGDEYYSDFIGRDKRYDMIFGHGMFEKTSFNHTNDKVKKKAHIFNSRDIARICKGLCLFGHIHPRTKIINNKIYYIGRFRRERFDDEKAVGFMVTAYFPEDSVYCFEYIDNIYSPTFKTITIDNAESIDNVHEYCNSILQLEYDNVRLLVKINSRSNKEVTNIEIIRNFFNNYKNIKIMIKDEIIKKSKELEKENISNLKEKYGYLFNKDINEYEKAHIFIKEEYGKNIDVELIKEYTGKGLN